MSNSFPFRPRSVKAPEFYIMQQNRCQFSVFTLQCEKDILCRYHELYLRFLSPVFRDKGFCGTLQRRTLFLSN